MTMSASARIRSCAIAAPVIVTLTAATAAGADFALNVSWGDHIMVCRGTARLDTPEKIRRAMRYWKEEIGVTDVFWRVSALFLEEDFVFHKEARTRYPEVARAIFARFDPVAAAVREAHACGLRIYAYHTIFDEGCPPSVLYGGKVPFPWQSKFTIAHPEYLVVDRGGQNKHWGVMEYGYPAVRRYKVQQFRRLIERYDFDGVSVCTRSHSPPAEFADQYGFNEPVVRAYRERYGIDIRTQPFDKEKWRRLRGEFLTQFFRELRTALPRKKVLAAIPRGQYIGPPYGNLRLDWETWIREGLVDGLVVGVVSGKWLYPNQSRSDREKGYLCSQEEGLGVGPVAHDIEHVYGPKCRAHGRALFVPAASPDSATALLRLPGVTGVMFSSLASGTTSPRIYVPDHPQLDLTNARFTIEFRVFLRRRSDWPRILSKYDHTLPDDAGRGWEIMLSPAGRVRLRVNDGERDRVVESAGALSEKRWVHVACVSEGAGGRLRIYIDGREDANTAPAPGRIRPTPCPLYFGAYAGGLRRLDGLLDEVRISQNPLAFPKVPANPYTGREPGTIVLWNFDGGDDQTFPGIGPVPGLGGRIHSGLDPGPMYAAGPPGFGRALDLTSR